MTYDEALKVVLKVAETLEKNKSYINELDEKLGAGNLGSHLAETIQKSIENIHKLNTNELSVLFRAISKIVSKFGGKIGKVYGQALKEVAEKIAGKQELNLPDLVLIVDSMLNKFKHRSRDKGINEHLQFWEEFKKGLEKPNGGKPLGRVLKEILNDIKWAYPATRSNSRSLVRVLVIRTILKNI